jgi:hypothetical protein
LKIGNAGKNRVALLRGGRGNNRNYKSPIFSEQEGSAYNGAIEIIGVVRDPATCAREMTWFGGHLST